MPTSASAETSINPQYRTAQLQRCRDMVIWMNQLRIVFTVAFPFIQMMVVDFRDLESEVTPVSINSALIQPELTFCPDDYQLPSADPFDGPGGNFHNRCHPKTWFLPLLQSVGRKKISWIVSTPKRFIIYSKIYCPLCKHVWDRILRGFIRL